MKEYKFRAWDIKRKYMFTPIENLVTTNNEGYPHVEQTFNNFSNDWRDNGVASEHDGDKIGSILMQFTGMIDSRGVEVYTGDIVEVEAEGSKWTMTVTMSQFCCDGTEESRIQDGYEGTVLVTVIGNIYDKELKEVKN